MPSEPKYIPGGTYFAATWGTASLVAGVAGVVPAGVVPGSVRERFENDLVAIGPTAVVGAGVVGCTSDLMVEPTDLKIVDVAGGVVVVAGRLESAPLMIDENDGPLGGGGVGAGVGVGVLAPKRNVADTVGGVTVVLGGVTAGVGVAGVFAGVMIGFGRLKPMESRSTIRAWTQSAKPVRSLRRLPRRREPFFPCLWPRGE